MNLLKRKHTTAGQKIRIPYRSKWWHTLNKAGWHTDYVNEKSVATMSKT